MNRVATSKYLGFFFAGIAALFLVVGSTGDLLAQEGIPPMPDGARKLQVFAGNWEGTISMTQGEETGSGKVYHTSKPIADNWGLEILEICEIEGMQTYRALNMFGYDMNTGLTHLYTVDNYADVHDHKGRWADEKTLNLQHEGMTGDKASKEVLEIVVDSPTQYHYTVHGYVGGELAYTMQATLHKK